MDQTGLGVAGCAGSSHCGPGTAGAGTGCRTGTSRRSGQMSWSDLFPSPSESKNVQLDCSVKFLVCVSYG